MENKFILSFIDNELYDTGFIGFPDYKPTIAVRGKTAGAYGKSGSFQWTSAVQALTVLCIKTAAECALPQAAVLRGGAGTLASSLDYAIAKNPIWLMEMFGAHLRGEGFVRRLIKITNPNRKRPGPVVLSINQQILPASKIEIFLNGKRCEHQAELHALADKITLGSGLMVEPGKSFSIAA